MSEISNNSDYSAKKQFFSRGVALFIGAWAIYAVLGTWIPIITKHEFDSFFSFIFLFIFPIPCTLAAVYFFYTAGYLWRGISSKGIHKLSVCLSLIFAVMLLPLVSMIKPAFLTSDEIFWSEFSNPFIMIAAGLFYLCAKRCLLKWFSLKEVLDYNTHRKATKLYFGFLAFFIWSSISATTELLPSHPDHEGLPANHWLASLIIFGSIPLAFWCYRLGLNFFLEKAPGSSEKRWPDKENPG